MAGKKGGSRTGSPEVRVRDNTPLMFLMLLMVPLYGGYYQYTVLLAGAVLAACLLYTVWQRRELELPVGPEAWVLYGLAAVYLLTSPLGVSPGMALTGALRPVVWVLFFWYAASYTGEERAKILDDLALEGAVLSLVSCVIFLVDRMDGVRDPNGRVDGFFEYANSWALYLLVCLILLLWKEERKKRDYAALAVLTVGIFLSGSRGVILLLLPLAVFFGIHHIIRRKSLVPVLIGGGALVALAGVAVVLSGGLLLDRLAAVSLSSSSLNGRLLYWLDGLNILKAHPLGIGRGGYLYLQPLYQTGDYVLRFIHNEYLQAALDGGILAGLLLLALPVCLLLRRSGIGLRERLAVLVIAIHAATDFDLQFTALMFLLLLCGSGGKTKKLTLLAPGRFRAAASGCAAAGFLLLLLAVPYLLNFLGNTSAASALYPWDLFLAEEHLTACETPAEAEGAADHILKQTDLSLLAWDCKAQAHTARGELPEAARARYEYLRLNPYRGEVYTDFAAFLEKACETASPEELGEYGMLAQKASDRLREVIDQTHPLAYRIAEKPDWAFSEPVQEVFARIAQEGKEKGSLNG